MTLDDVWIGESGLPVVWPVVNTVGNFTPLTEHWYEGALVNALSDEMEMGNSSELYWGEPVAKEGHPLIMSVSVPLFLHRSNHKVIGVMGVDYSLETIEAQLKESMGVELGGESYIFDEQSHLLVAATFPSSNHERARARVRCDNSNIEAIVETTTWLVEKRYICPPEDLLKEPASPGPTEISNSHHLTNSTTSPSSAPSESPTVPESICRNHDLLILGKTRTIYNHNNEYDVTISRFELPATFPLSPSNNAQSWIVVTLIPTSYAVTWIDKVQAPSDYAFILIASIFSFTICFILFAFVTSNRATNVIKLGQPTFLIAVTIGGMVMSLSPLMFLDRPNSFNCLFQFFFLHVSFTFTFSALLWKNHRAWKVAKAAADMKKIQFSNADVYKYIGIITSFEIALQLGTIIFEPTTPGLEYYSLPLSNSFHTGSDEEQEAEVCVMSGHDAMLKGRIQTYGGYFLFCSVMLKLSLLFFGCILVVRTKSYSQHYAESHALGVTLYTLSITGVALTFSTMIADSNQQLRCWAAGISFNVVFGMIMICGPRIWRLVRHGDYGREELMERTKKRNFLPSNFGVSSPAPAQRSFGRGGGGGGSNASSGGGQSFFKSGESASQCFDTEEVEVVENPMPDSPVIEERKSRTSLFNLNDIIFSTDPTDLIYQPSAPKSARPQSQKIEMSRRDSHLNPIVACEESREGEGVTWSRYRSDANKPVRPRPPPPPPGA